MNRADGEFKATAVQERAGGDPAGPLRVLYITGTSYCGSTLLSFLLNTHPQIASVGEETGPVVSMADYAQFPCSCHATLGDCPFWREVGERMKSAGFAFGPNQWNMTYVLGKGRWTRHMLTRSLRNNTLDAIRDALVYRVPPWGNHLRRQGARNSALVRTVLAMTGKQVFAGAGKDPIRARYLKRQPDFDVRVIHLIRDACGYVSSSMKNHGLGLVPATRSWIRIAGHVNRLQAIMPSDRWLMVRYEDLCTKIEEEMARMARFAGLEPHPGPYHFRDVEHHIIGNRMRLTDSREVELDQKWRSRLTDEQIRQIEQMTQPLRKRYGYV